MPITPNEIFANPSSLITTKLSALFRSNIFVAVYSGLDDCRPPATKRRMPTAQKINHFPISNHSKVSFSKCTSYVIEKTGRMTSRRIFITKKLLIFLLVVFFLLSPDFIFCSIIFQFFCDLIVLLFYREKYFLSQKMIFLHLFAHSVAYVYE